MRTALILITLIFTLSAAAQTGWTRQDKRDYEKADFAFYQEDYVLAAKIFGLLYETHKDRSAMNWKYGAALLNLNEQRELAVALLENALNAGEAEARFHFARALHRSYELDDAIRHFTLYNEADKKENSSLIIDRHIQMCQRAKRMLANPVDVKITNLGPTINTSDKEYVPIVSADGSELFFTSRRSDSTAQLKDPNDEYFEDVYSSTKNSDTWSESKNVGMPINSETHDATVALSADGSTLIIYRTNENLIGGDLYISEKQGDTWSSPSKLGPQINSDFQEASACLSANASIMIFSSNRPGGFGGKDLYRVKRLPNGEWSLPKNLGPNINSTYDEDAPFLDFDEQTLYFSSRGHATMGGFDIFMSSKIDPETWSIPENIGYPLNTVDDDIYLTVDAGGRRGYYSSEQRNGFGQLDIYQVDFLYRQQKTMVLKGELRDIDGNPIQGTITLFDQFERNIHGVYNSNANNGKFILIINPLTIYKVFIEAQGYSTQEDELYFLLPKEGELDFQIAPYVLIN